MSENEQDQLLGRDLPVRAIEDVLAAVHAAASTAELFLARPSSHMDQSFAFRKAQVEIAVTVLTAAPALLKGLQDLSNMTSLMDRLTVDSRWRRGSESQ
jgi:hypothetical protein